jgi:hypothetical protein
MVTPSFSDNGSDRARLYGTLGRLAHHTVRIQNEYLLFRGRYYLACFWECHDAFPFLLFRMLYIFRCNPIPVTGARS